MTDGPTCGCDDGHRPDVDLAFAAGVLADRLRVIADAATRGEVPFAQADRDKLVRELDQLNDFLDAGH